LFTYQRDSTLVWDNAPGALIRINVRDHRVNWAKDVSVAAGALEALQVIAMRGCRIRGELQSHSPTVSNAKFISPQAGRLYPGFFICFMSRSEKLSFFS
jgi:hypothetical protein